LHNQNLFRTRGRALLYTLKGAAIKKTIFTKNCVFLFWY